MEADIVKDVLLQAFEAKNTLFTEEYRPLYKPREEVLQDWIDLELADSVAAPAEIDEVDENGDPVPSAVV